MGFVDIRKLVISSLSRVRAPSFICNTILTCTLLGLFRLKITLCYTCFVISSFVSGMSLCVLAI